MNSLDFNNVEVIYTAIHYNIAKELQSRALAMSKIMNRKVVLTSFAGNPDQFSSLYIRTDGDEITITITDNTNGEEELLLKETSDSFSGKHGELIEYIESVKEYYLKG